ncbi:hypothetical protein [Thalassoroseus pseudoceratinae]|uniref:hypothetical protein n=1 Tax=Thalassoroseus pseudoceratinae TaxID=2713176 RepID=UPI00141FF4F1|nr:hypothetical protein [Thalassoroseus pseudoceratinae]
MTNQDLRQQLLQLRKRVRQLLALYGVSWLVAVVFGGLFLAGFLDWLIRIDDPGIRLIFGCSILIGSAWIAWRLLITPLRRTLSDIDIALRIEKRYPGFRDSFASTVQFLDGECDARIGSPDLQRQVVQQTLRHVRQLRVEELVETRPIRRAVMVAIGVCLVVAVVAGFNQANASTALQRLLFPFAERPWPKKTRLVILDQQFQPIGTQIEPLRIARGDRLDLYIENERGDLPDDVKLLIRTDAPTTSSPKTTDGTDPETTAGVRTETVRKVTRQDDRGDARPVGVSQLRPLEEQLWFRAVGGDDDEMPWHKVEVVPPPQIDSLQVTLTPPEYLGKPPAELPPGTGHVEGFLGTRVDITLHVNKPLRTARLRVKEAPAIAIPINADDKRTLQTSFVIEEAGVYSYWFELQDYQGFEDADAPRYEVRGIADNTPDVWIALPETDRQVTPTAVVPFRLGAKDDLGLAGLRLVYQIADAESKSEPVSISLPFEGEDRMQQVANYELDLSQFALQPGQQVVTWAEAEDAFRIDEQRHIGRSLTRTLSIVTPEQKTREFEDRQSGLVDELADVEESQRQARETIQQLQIQLENAGELRPEDIDQLKRVEMEQKQIGSRLTHPLDGIDARAENIQDEMQANAIQSEPMQQRLKRIREELRVIQEDHLPEIERALIDTRKQAESETNASTKPSEDEQRNRQKEQLEETAGEQDAILKSLGTLLDELSEWRRQRDLSTDIENLRDEQDSLNNERAEIGQRTLGKNRSKLSPQDRADLAKLADRQRDQAERIEKLQSDLKKSAETLKESRPDIAERLDDAQRHLSESATAGMLREAAQSLAENEIGSAAEQQSQATEQLKELDDILQNRGAANTEELVNELETLRKRLEELKHDQTEMLRKMQDAESIDDPKEQKQELERLRKEQEELQQRAAELARELRRMQAGRPGSSARRAASRMEEAVQRLTKEDPNAVEEMQEALEDLERAEQELAEEQQAAEEQLARELLEKIADEITAFVERQQAVIDETNRLEAERRDRGRLTRGQLVSLRNLAELQITLADETSELAKKIEAAAVFALAIRGAEHNMRQAAERLQKRMTDRSTIDAEEAARDRFLDLVAALEKNKKEPDAEQETDGEQADQQQDKPQSGGPQTDGIPQLAQLKMLKSLQEDILRRTAKLDRKRADGELNEDQQAELAELTEQQSTLADITRNLTKQVMDSFGGDPIGSEPDPSEPDEPQTKPAKAKKPESKSKDDELKDLGIDLDLELDDLTPEKPE